MLGRCNPRMCLTLVGPIHAVRIISYLLWARVTPVPVLTSERHAWWACHRGLVGAFNTTIELVLSVTLEVVLCLRLAHSRYRLLLVHPMPRRSGHGWTVLWVSSP